MSSNNFAVTNTLKANGKNVQFGAAQNAANYEICIPFSSKNTPILRHYNENWSPVVSFSNESRLPSCGPGKNRIWGVESGYEPVLNPNKS
jgi:hypothetical protein